MGKSWGVLLVLMILWRPPVGATAEFSPCFLGMYRKTMETDSELFTYAARYGLDPRTARAVVLQESGGNAHLVSSAGARGYFQVMPRTFRMLGVPTNIEAGIEYLAQLQRQFRREDYAIAAYNAGPGTVSRDRPLRLETLQYVINVGHYKSVLRLHEPEVRRQAETVKLHRVQKGESWIAIARKTGVPAPLLLLYNPFLATRPLRVGALVAYPSVVPTNLLEYVGEDLYYTARIGDSYLNLALVFGVDLETFRQHNDLWRLQQLPVGVRLRVAVKQDSPFRNPQLGPPAEAPRVVLAAQEANTTTPPLTSQPPRMHRVRRGDTLRAIARRYRTSVRALMRANGLGNSRIQTGTSLLIPPRVTGQSSHSKPSHGGRSQATSV